MASDSLQNFKVSLSFFELNQMKWFFIVSLNKCWLYDKKLFHFKIEKLTEILQAVRCHILWLY